MQIESKQTGAFASVPIELTASVFHHLNPIVYYKGTVSLVCKAWNEIMKVIIPEWTKKYKVQFESPLKKYCCKVKDYTGLVKIWGKLGAPKGIAISCYFFGALVPYYKVTIGSHALIPDRSLIQPGFRVPKSSDFEYINSDQIEFRFVTPEIIKIQEHDTDGAESTVYVDTSFEYYHEDGVSYFVYDFLPRTMAHDEVETRFTTLMAEKAFSQYRCIYNRFGIVIEGFDEEGHHMYLSRPDQKLFTEVIVSPSFPTPFIEKTYHHSKKPKTLADMLEGFYGGPSRTPVVVNFASKEHETGMIPYLDGEEATVFVQTNGFSTPYPIKDPIT